MFKKIILITLFLGLATPAMASVPANQAPSQQNVQSDVHWNPGGF